MVIYREGEKISLKEICRCLRGGRGKRVPLQNQNSSRESPEKASCWVSTRVLEGCSVLYFVKKTHTDGPALSLSSPQVGRLGEVRGGGRRRQRVQAVHKSCCGLLK